MPCLVCLKRNDVVPCRKRHKVRSICGKLPQQQNESTVPDVSWRALAETRLSRQLLPRLALQTGLMDVCISWRRQIHMANAMPPQGHWSHGTHSRQLPHLTCTLISLPQKARSTLTRPSSQLLLIYHLAPSKSHLLALWLIPWQPGCATGICRQTQGKGRASQVCQQRCRQRTAPQQPD